jgi:hypothetical protein
MTELVPFRLQASSVPMHEVRKPEAQDAEYSVPRSETTHGEVGSASVRPLSVMFKLERRY